MRSEAVIRISTTVGCRVVSTAGELQTGSPWLICCHASICDVETAWVESALPGCGFADEEAVVSEEAAAVQPHHLQGVLAATCAMRDALARVLEGIRQVCI